MITVEKDVEGRTVSTNGALADAMKWISRENNFKLSFFALSLSFKSGY